MDGGSGSGARRPADGGWRSGEAKLYGGEPVAARLVSLGAGFPGLPVTCSEDWGVTGLTDWGYGLLLGLCVIA